MTFECELNRFGRNFSLLRLLIFSLYLARSATHTVSHIYIFSLLVDGISDLPIYTRIAVQVCVRIDGTIPTAFMQWIQTTSFTPLDLRITVISLIEIRVYIYVYALFPLCFRQRSLSSFDAHIRHYGLQNMCTAYFLSSPSAAYFGHSHSRPEYSTSKYISIYTNNYHVVAGYTHQMYTRTCMPQVYGSTRISVWVFATEKSGRNKQTKKRKEKNERIKCCRWRLFFTRKTLFGCVCICPLVNM